MNLRDGVRGVRSKLGEGKPWLFKNSDIIRDLNFSASGMTSEAQALRDTYAGTTKLIGPSHPGIYYQEYAMPQNCEMIVAAKIKIGILYPINFRFTQQELQIFGYVASTPYAGYLRRGINLTQQIPGSSEAVLPAPGNPEGLAEWIMGFYPNPSQAFDFFVDYIAYHPIMKDPMDLCLIPSKADFYDTWIAYAISNGFEKMGDMINADRYKLIYNNGVRKFADYIFAAQAQVTPPRYGGSDPSNLNPYAAVMAPTAGNLTIQGG